MIIREIDGNLFESDAELLLHQVNCKGIMGSGIALTIKQQYPKVYKEYVNFCKDYVDELKTYELLGKTLIVPINMTQSIVNVFGQDGFGKGLQTDYKAIKWAFEMLAYTLKSEDIKKIALPYKMGCDRAGGDWGTYLGIIEEALEEWDGVLEIWALPKK